MKTKSKLIQIFGYLCWPMTENLFSSIYIFEMRGEFKNIFYISQNEKKTPKITSMMISKCDLEENPAVS